MTTDDTVFDFQRILPLQRRSPVPAWLFSTLLHALLLAIALIQLPWFDRGADVTPQRVGGIVLVKLVAETTEYLTEGDVERVEQATSRSTALPELPRAADVPQLEGVGPPPPRDLGIGDETIDATPGADALVRPVQDRSGKVGGEVTIEFFGIAGTGNQFVYMFDRSGSMEGNEGRPLRAAKRELLKSLASLGPTQRFQLVLYNHEPRCFSPKGNSLQLHFADEPSKAQATRFIESIRGEGGTNHLKAIKLALQFGPDVLFILSDAEGGFTAAELSRIASWNRSNAVIHVVEFGDGAQSAHSDRSFERLAREHRGQYLYKNVATFQD